MNDVLAAINHADKEQRLAAIRTLRQAIAAGALPAPVQQGFVNNHIHTTFSFSPYSPTAAVWNAYQAGLLSAGIMDHDSIAGAEEFIEAGRIIGLPTTIGVECRVDFSRTAMAGKSINHPDQTSCAYVALHGVPHPMIPKVLAFFRPFMQARDVRNRAMTAKLNGVLAEVGVALDYDRDVLPISEWRNGGAVTERHLLCAAANQLIALAGKGEALVQVLEQKLHLTLAAKVRGFLLDVANPHYVYDLLGVLKSDFTAKFYIPAQAELPQPEALAAFNREIGAILAYAYLGDVGSSVTGDKKTQQFEDAYLDTLFVEIQRLGFNAVTYMPSRNTLPQLQRVQALCHAHGLLEISGEDINSSRQSFICPALAQPEFSHLSDMTWALIGHERCASADPASGFFSPATIRQYPALAERVAHFKKL